MTTTERPSEAAYKPRGRKTGRPPQADDRRIVNLVYRPGPPIMPKARAQSSDSPGLRSTVPSAITTNGQSVAEGRITRNQFGGIVICDRVEQMIRDAVCG